MAHSHPHLNVAVPLLGELAGELVRLPRWVDLAELDGLRAELGELLTELALLVGHEGPARAQCWYEYRREPARRRHALAYYGRPFPAWDRPGQGRDYGLLAGGARSPAIVAWRRAIAVPERDALAEPPPCPACGAPLDLLRPTRRYSADGIFWRVGAREWAPSEARPPPA